MVDAVASHSLPLAGGGRLAENNMHFGRVLRAAGMPVGPGKILDAVNAVRAVGVASRRDFYWSLHAVFVNRRDQHEKQYRRQYWNRDDRRKEPQAVTRPRPERPRPT